MVNMLSKYASFKLDILWFTIFQVLSDFDVSKLKFHIDEPKANYNVGF